MQFNTRHRVGDGDGGQASAVHESISADGGYTVGNGDRGQTTAAIESFSTCTVEGSYQIAIR